MSEDPPKTNGKNFLDQLAKQLANNPLEIILKATPLIFILILIVVLGIRIGSIQGNDDILRDLSDPSVARGLITLLFAVATVWVAMILALAAVGDNSSDEKFGRGKDVLTILVGILGTIIGYYFGAESQQQQNQQPSVNEVQVIPEDRQLPNSVEQDATQQVIPEDRQLPSDTNQDGG